MYFQYILKPDGSSPLEAYKSPLEASHPTSCEHGRQDFLPFFVYNGMGAKVALWDSTYFLLTGCYDLYWMTRIFPFRTS
jgi:hypothetical protein